jgi:prolipoprotein diacylglyceryl transferase
MTPDLLPFVIPSPDQGVWHIGPVPVRAYALCILAGVFAGIWLTNKRFVARGGLPGTASDIAVWAVPFGLVGARLYHVISDYQLYFGPGQRPIEALYIWQGGLGIWGSVSMGALGAYIGCRRNGISFSAFADAIAPGLALGQAIGRWGNWFNQELFGKPTDLPWALEIDIENRPPGYEQFETFHPTFLYEFIWNLGVVGLLLWADRRFKLGFGRVFWLYVMAYTAGRGWIEYLRIDTVNEVMGLRLNVWTSIIVFLLALAFFVRITRRRKGREAVVDRRVEAARAEADSAGTSDASAASTSDADATPDPPTDSR